MPPAAAGFDFAVSATADGDLAVVSPPASGPLASPEIPSGRPSTAAEPLVVALPSPLRRQVVSIAAGETHVLVFARDGSLWSFGRGLEGQLGLGESATAAEAPRPVLGPGSSGPSTSRVVSFSAGARHSLALTADGEAFAWGWGTHGQCGAPALDAVHAPRPVAGAPPGAAEVAAGGAHSLVRTADGHVYAFGRNDAGQLGFEGASTADPTLLDPQAFGFRPVAAVAAGSRHSVALAGEEAEVHTWGDGTHGQLGRAGAARAPAKIAGVRGAKRIVAGWWHTVVEV